jgi:hypothetical protein
MYPFDYNSGLKLMEHSWIQNSFVRTVMALLSPGREWHCNRIVWAGDYMDYELYLPDNYKDLPEYIEWVKQEGKGVIPTLYHYITLLPNSRLLNIDPYEGPNIDYILNHDRREYVSLLNLPFDDGWNIHPLPLLTASGNGRGNGDYGGSNEDIVGLWANDAISSSYTIPEGFTELVTSFIE